MPPPRNPRRRGRQWRCGHCGKRSGPCGRKGVLCRRSGNGSRRRSSSLRRCVNKGAIVPCHGPLPKKPKKKPRTGRGRRVGEVDQSGHPGSSDSAIRLSFPLWISSAASRFPASAFRSRSGPRPVCFPAMACRPGSGGAQLTRVAAISAKVGSISDNHLGGWYAYRCSKAALNMLVKNLSVELPRRYRPVACVALHPGTTRSGLSEPFSQSLASLTVHEPEGTADNLFRVIEALQEQDNGRFTSWDGSDVPW